MKETFARSSVSCLTGGADLRSVTAVRGDPCWQVSQQLHLLIQKVGRSKVKKVMGSFDLFSSVSALFCIKIPPHTQRSYPALPEHTHPLSLSHTHTDTLTANK